MFYKITNLFLFAPNDRNLFFKELKGFKRVSLDPGETKTVEFNLGTDALSFLNRDMHRVVEPGTFKIMAGGNSVDLIEATLEVADIDL